MEKNDTLLIEKHIKEDERLRKYVEEHMLFEKQLDELNKKTHLTSAEEVEQKRIKKLKLSGRDKIETLLKKYR
jgi:hypothetical protein